MTRPLLTNAPSFRPRLAWFSATALMVLTLAGCGGGGSSSGTATTNGGSTTASVQSANGTVTGLASVVVDGVDYQDATAKVQVENADGTVSNASAKLGQSVQVVHDGNGSASVVTVNAAVIGSVSQINATAQSLTVAGQAVLTNSSATAGPITAYGGGYAGFADIKAADLAEVHGTPVYNSTSKVYELVATRIEKQAAISNVRVTGTVSSLNTASKSFAINGLTVNYAAATLSPASATLANGANVRVWGAANGLTGSGSTLVLAAARVSMVSVLPAGQVSGTAQLSGLASSVSATSFQLQGVKVNLGTATVTPAGTSISNGAYVDITGAVGTDGTVTASTVRVRVQSTANDTATVRLMGAISSLTSQASFVLRDLVVDASAITLSTACPGVTLAVGTVVDLTATLLTGSNAVKAKTLVCQSKPVPYTIRSVTGVASAVNTTSKTFALTPAAAGSAAQIVQWSEQTLFAGVTPSTSAVTSVTVALTGATVVVDGYLDSSNVLVARSVRNPASVLGHRDADRDSPELTKAMAASVQGGFKD